MRAVVQRVSEAAVKVDNKVVGEIGKGLLVFLGIGEGDTEKDLEYLVDKVLGLRIFQDENDKILVISQFTLYGDVRKGKRPSFTDSAHPDIAERMYLEFIDKCKTKEIKTEKGIFGADMKVSLINDGPVTILLDSKKTF